MILEVSLGYMPCSPGQESFDLSTGSRHRKLRDLPIPKFVEPVETNPDVTSAFAPHPRPFDPSTSSGTVGSSTEIRTPQAQSLAR